MLGIADRLVLVEEALNVLLVGGGVIVRQQDGAAGETGLDGIQGRFGLALGSFGTGRSLCVDAIGMDLLSEDMERNLREHGNRGAWARGRGFEDKLLSDLGIKVSCARD